MPNRYQHHTYPGGCDLEVDDTCRYLETYFDVSEGTISIQHNSRNKLRDMLRGHRDIMRLHDYNSFIPHDMKLGMIIGHISRIVTNCMVDGDVVMPLIDMVCEYMMLQYPMSVVLKACMRAHRKRPHEGLAWVIDNIANTSMHL